MNVDEYLKPITNPSIENGDLLFQTGEKYKELSALMAKIDNREMALARDRLEESLHWVYAAVVKEEHKS